MSEIDNFETLSNAELRAKCMKHGLPNVPVTDSSRSVLIKKLRATISGSPMLGNKKSSSSSNRRETIHASKVYPSIDEVKAATASKDDVAPRTPNRGANRRTIATTPSSLSSRDVVTAAAVSNVTTNAAPITVRRRSVREHIVQKISMPGESHPVLLESDEEEDMFIANAARRAEQLNSYKTSNVDIYPKSRASRSNSLSKTGVLTTSYVQETVPVAPPVVIEDDEEDGEIVDSDGGFGSHIIPEHSSTFNRYSSAHVATQAARKLPTETFVTPKLYTSPVQTTQYVPKGIGSNLTSRYSSNLGKPSYYAPSNIRHSTTGSTLPSSQRYMPPPPTKTRTSAVTASYYTEQSEDTDTNNEDEPVKTPFLSSFARTLERTKVEPINVGDGGYMRRYTRGSKVYESPGRRPRISQVNDDVTMQQVFEALDEKYHIKRNFAFLVVVMLVVLLFVIFWK